MKTNTRTLKILGAGSLFAFAAMIPALQAGPGIDYWTGQGRPDSAAVAATPASPPKVCTDSKMIPITEARKEFPNGKGRTLYVQVGTKQVCTSCASPGTVMVPSWPNGKGPLVAKTVAMTHNCDAICLVR